MCVCVCVCGRLNSRVKLHQAWHRVISRDFAWA